ncbi:PP2C family protein-serine/threonine phosphatase [Streptomyces sp. P9(2023)]|uniref:PP2C family protein-serine/threonine phosphatase n=1 Tax=Streptomyces sp. P9(2023) TaxID=3064394 RepID=UPI0028F435BC|nr:PP2C family protein-serine/threonine phosphatase [Streptomyces sp. P9(2023)]MDT9686825.1 PP2C family protein-serine/threonine phosphatase [Streptomyces sp. P9(2023)]
MSFPLPDTVDALKGMIGREVASLRAAVRRTAERPIAGPGGTEMASPLQSLSVLPATAETDGASRCLCSSHAPGDSGACSLLPAIPASAVLLEPVWDEAGAVLDFRIVAGNRVRSVEWLEAPHRQVGQRFLEARPGAAHSGLLAALAEVVDTGRPLDGRVVDYTEQRLGRIHRAPLLYTAARCGLQVLATWRPVQSQAELLTIDAQYLASMGWGNWDLLSGKVTWSEGLSRIFHADVRMPWSLEQLCDALLADDLTAFSEFLASVLAGEEPAWTRIRFLVLGELRTLDLLGRPVAGTDGRPWAVNLVARDLTPQIRSRRRLAETERESDRLRRQTEAERRVADALREAILPTHSEALAAVGLTVAASYRPAEPDAAVGGDWYKCRLLPDGRVLVAIGDASGHGLDAVARMAQQRHALAGLAQTGASAGEITTWLNELVCSDPAGQTATVVAGHIGEDKLLRWADAGHPAPLLLRDGAVEPMGTEQRGPLLGALPGYAYETSSAPLLPGDLLVLYTDGMVERRDEDVTVGIDRLANAVADSSTLEPQQLIDTLVADPELAGHEDDACVLAIRVD